MASVLGLCCCSAYAGSSLSRAGMSRCQSWRSGAEFSGLKSFWLGEWSGHDFSASRRSRLRDPDRKRVHLVAAWDEIYRNQVLVSSTIAGILGQLVKPVTSAASGKGFNMKLIIKPGGMPSTHSAVVTAAATAMGLERGFSDSLFGFSVIVAALFMYDAQGVRRSVGKQAEVINTIVFTQMSNSVPESSSSSSSPPNPSPYSIGAELARDPVQAELKFMEEADSSVSTAKASKSTAVYNDLKVNGTPSFSTQISDEKSVMNGSALGRTQGFFEVAESLPSVKDGQVTLQEIGNLSGWRHIPLKESVGHTKLEVLIGAIWGMAVTVALHSGFQF
ncbi:hypothetical protein Mapa_014096 [Marchantia paleacea]|nr:hypothetical protein Mapa_014096 [Marchantia paleacea]